MSTCIDCGQEFRPPHQYPDVPRCLPCWRRHKRQESAKGVVSASEYERILKLVREAQSRVLELEHENDRLRGRHELADELRPRIRPLLSLTHPDRHGNSQASNDVTRWLLDLRSRLEVRT